MLCVQGHVFLKFDELNDALTLQSGGGVVSRSVLHNILVKRFISVGCSVDDNCENSTGI